MKTIIAVNIHNFGYDYLNVFEDETNAVGWCVEEFVDCFNYDNQSETDEKLRETIAALNAAKTLEDVRVATNSYDEHQFNVRFRKREIECR